MTSNKIPGEWKDSRFTKKTTAIEAMEMLTAEYENGGKSLQDKVVILTGANSGIGFEAAVAFAKAGMTLVAVCRSMEKARKAASEIAEKAGLSEDKRAAVVPAEMDLASIESIAKFVDAFKSGKIIDEPRLHILVNNAGIMQLPEYTESEDGVEKQFAINVLAPHLLTHEFTDLLKKSATREAPSRVIFVASSAHEAFKLSKFEESLPVSKEDYGSGWNSYASSKLCDILEAKDIQDRLASDPEHPVVAFALHPGVIKTGLGRNAAPFSLTYWIYRFPNMALKLGLHKTTEAGATPTVRAALDKKLVDNMASLPLYFDSDANPTEPSVPKDIDAAAKKVRETCNRIIQDKAGVTLSAA